MYCARILLHVSDPIKKIHPGPKESNTYDKSRDCFEFLAIQPMVHCPLNYRCFCPLSSQYCLAQQTIRVFCSQDTFFVLHDLQQLPQGDSNLAVELDISNGFSEKKWIHYSKYMMLQSQSVCLNFGTQIHGTKIEFQVAKYHALMYISSDLNPQELVIVVVCN